jgi:hypothetical protein
MPESSIKKSKLHSKNWCYRHQCDKYFCKECGGKGICQHGRERRRCKDCGGRDICIHMIIKRFCTKCKGSGICLHGRQKPKCKECHCSGICIHNRQKKCKDCGGSTNSPIDENWGLFDNYDTSSSGNSGPIDENWELFDNYDTSSSGDELIFHSKNDDLPSLYSVPISESDVNGKNFSFIFRM